LRREIAARPHNSLNIVKNLSREHLPQAGLISANTYGRFAVADASGSGRSSTSARHARAHQITRVIVGPHDPNRDVDQPC
jgi:hypothetical protein